MGQTCGWVLQRISFVAISWKLLVRSSSHWMFHGQKTWIVPLWKRFHVFLLKRTGIGLVRYSINSNVFIVIALRKTPSFHGYGPTLGKLKSLPAFWTLVLLLLLGVIRYVILEAWSQSSLSFLLRVSFILSCVLKLAIVGLFNYTQINSIRRRSSTLVLVLVKITLVEILLQSITDFCLGILQLALHADDLNHLQVGNSNNFRTVADLFRKSAECTFHYKVMNFFWQKLFRDNRNILENNHVLLD